MRSIQSKALRILSFCLLLCLLDSTVFASSPGFGPITDSDQAVLLPDPYEMSRISAGFRVAFIEYYRGCGTKSSGSDQFPDYFAGFYNNANGTVVMCLTEISEEILAEVRTAIYGGEFEVNTEYLDQWFPTMSYRRVTYNFEQLMDLQLELQERLAAADCGDYDVRIDFEQNQVAAFSETAEGLALAAETVDSTATPNLLLVLPMDELEAWKVSYNSRNTTQLPEESAAQDSPANPDAETSTDVRAGMENRFYDEDYSLCAGTVGFTAFLTYWGDDDEELGLYYGDTVETFFSHGHDISGIYPYSTIENGLGYADLLYYTYSPSVRDYSIYQPKYGSSISSRRYDSTRHFGTYCTNVSEITAYCSDGVCFYGATSGERSFSVSDLTVESGALSWVDSGAVSQPGDSGAPIYGYYNDRNGTQKLALVGIVTESNSWQGGEGYTVYRIMDDVDFNTDFEFDELCLN